jgi:ketosteroid isomerase-like protein
MRGQLCIATCLAAVMAGCATPPPGQSAADIRTDIDAVNQELAGCFAGGEAECVAAAFSEDGWQLLSNASPLTGPEAVRRYWQQAFGWGQWELVLTSQLVEPSDPLAVERGRYTIRFTAGPGAPPNRPSTEDRGTYIVHWRHDSSGKWRIAAQALITEQPARVIAVPAGPR